MTGPYAGAVAPYWAAGWRGVLPLPTRQKKHPPKGYTGHYGAWPSWPDVYAWTEDQPNANLALRLPENVAGIDVDDYDDKPGAASLAAREAQWGTLPPTVMSTSREAGASGIRLYRIPLGLQWPGEVGKGIEVIHYGHRYVVAAPSIHPEGRVYHWRTTEGEILDTIPSIDDLPELPDAWVTGLTGGAMRVDVAKADIDDVQVVEFLHSFPPGPACTAVARRSADALVHLSAGGSRHEAMRDDTLALVGFGARGCRGAQDALNGLRAAFVHAATRGNGARSEGEAVAEYLRALTGAVAIKAAEPPPTDPGCRCAPDVLSGPFGTVTPPQPPITTPNTPATVEQVNVAVETELAFNRGVSDELNKLRIRKAAQELFKAENQPDAPPFDAGTLGEVLARPADPPMRIDGLIPWDSSTLVVAQRKTGKTTLELNLARCLLTGEDFLGKFAVRPSDGIVAILNFEVSAAMLGRWADEHGIDRERLYLVNLRGRRNPFTHPDDRARLAEDLHARGVESLICDPFGRAYTGKSQNDPGEVGAWLIDLDLFARTEVGAKDVILSAHAGWNGERTRGSSALEDWADVFLTMTRDTDDDTMRFLKAEGRDVTLEEDQLVFDPTTRTLSLAGTGSRKQGRDDRKLADLAVLTVRAAREQPGIGVAAMITKIRAMDDAPTFRDGDVSRAAKHAADHGHLTIIGGGPGRKSSHFITDLSGAKP